MAVSARDKAKMQDRYCKKHSLPKFAPHDGVCWSCGTQIYKHISIERASGSLVTGCPICHRSYCA